MAKERDITRIVKIENDKNLTTAEIVTILKSNQDELIDIVEGLDPTRLFFNDGTSVDTQETKAEDIVSVEDVRQNDQRILDLQQQTQKDTDQDTLIQENQVRSTQNEQNIATNAGAILTNADNINTNAIGISNNSTSISTINAEQVTQNNRLTSLESNQISTVFDTALITDSGTVDTTPSVVTPTIIEDFKTDALAENTLVGTEQELSTLYKEDSLIEYEYYFNAIQGDTVTTSVVVQLWDLTNGVELDSATTVVDFAGATTVTSGTRQVFKQVDAGTTAQLRVYTTGGTVVVTDSACKIKVQAQQRSSTLDTDIISTTGFGQSNTQQDLLYLKGLIDGLSQQITTANQEIEKSRIKVGEYSFSAQTPDYGTWEEVSTTEGMALLFGGTSGTSSTTNGDIKKHNHIWATKAYQSNPAGSGDQKFAGVQTYNSEEGILEYKSQSDGTLTDTDAYTNKVGSDQNKAWGIKLGLRLWRRVS